MEATKKRTTNFTASEEELLISLVKKYKSVLECLKTDAVNAKMKKNAWFKIEREFNCQSIETPRTADILKNKYINLKRKIKKQYADEKVYHRGTGGGPSKSFLESSAAISIGEMLQNKMTGEVPIYDCDALNNEGTSDMIEINVSLSKENIDDHFIVMPDDNFDMHHATDHLEEPKTSGTTRNWKNCELGIVETDDVEEPSTSGVARDWIHYTPADLKSRSALTGNTSDGHVSKKCKGYQDKLSQWVSTRASLSNQQEKAFIDHNQLKMDQMREKHAVELQMMAEKHQMEIKNLKLTNEILQLQKEKCINTK